MGPCHNGKQQQAEEHHKPLEQIGPHRCQEPTDEDVGEHNAETDQRAGEIVHPEQRLEGLAGGVDLRAHIDDHEHGERSGRNTPQQMRPRFEAPFKKIRDGDRDHRYRSSV